MLKDRTLIYVLVGFLIINFFVDYQIQTVDGEILDILEGVLEAFRDHTHE